MSAARMPRDASDALDVTILRGGGPEVGAWATEHGFRLPPDAPEVLDFYANRSPMFLAAVFDAEAAAARGQARAQVLARLVRCLPQHSAQ